MTSLHQKIMTSYGLSNVALFIFAAVVITDLVSLKTQIEEGEAVKDFLTFTQEIRREEKNLLLYDDPADFFKLHQHIDAAQALFQDSRAVFLEVASDEELGRVDVLLGHYRDLLEQNQDIISSAPADKRVAFRAAGHELSVHATLFNDRQRLVLARTTQTAAWTLVGALLTIIMFGVFSAFFTVRQVVRPLDALEKQLDAVAEGQEQKLTLVSLDKEIQSFVFHFNTMLDRLRAQQSEMRHHEKAAALGVLVSGVAHELNNPLSNISTSVQLLMEEARETGTTQGNTWLENIDGESERARRIVRRLLESVRQPDLKFKALSAAEVVRAAAMLIFRQLPADVYLHIEDVPEACVQIDRDRMQQVFINLIWNAVDAGATNIYVIADVTTWQDSRPGVTDHLHGDVAHVSTSPAVMLFYVADDGPGIEPEDMTHLFTPFYTTKSSGEGTGLGLYLVEEIISEHHGCITVENRSDGGTQFLIWLPMSEEDIPK